MKIGENIVSEVPLLDAKTSLNKIINIIDEISSNTDKSLQKLKASPHMILAAITLLEDQKNSLIKTIESNIEQISQFKNKIGQNEREVSNLESENEALNRQKQDFLTRIQEAQVDLAKTLEIIKLKKEELENRSNRLKELETRTLDLSRDLKKNQDQLKQLEKELESTFSKKDRYVQGYENRVAAMKVLINKRYISSSLYQFIRALQVGSALDLKNILVAIDMREDHAKKIINKILEENGPIEYNPSNGKEVKDILGLIEQFETTFDELQQLIKRSSENIVENVSLVWKKLRMEQEEVSKLDSRLDSQNSELTGLRIRSGELDKKISEFKSKREESTAKSSELKTSLERIHDELKNPKLELGDIESRLTAVNQKISNKELEQSQLEKSKLDIENEEKRLKTSYTEEKMEELNIKLTRLKKDNYFTSFLIENSEVEMPEVEIIATIMAQGSCNLEDLKKLLDVPPIMAVRTIKQLAVKGIINLDENTNIITMP
jgi:chromosome segregation ATPase